MAAAFSIRAYAESRRASMAADFGPFAFAVRDLPPMEVRVFRWWEDELAALKASEAEEDEEAAPGRARAPKKRSISDLFAAAPPVDPSGSSAAARVGDDDEVLGAIRRRAKELRRRRRVEAEAAAAAVTLLTATAQAEPWSGEARDREANSARQKTLDKIDLQDELGSPEASEEPEAEQYIDMSKEKTPDHKEKKHEKVDIFQKNKVDKLKHVESRKAIKVGKQRDLKKILPLHSILKKYTKHTSVKMVKEKNRNSKRPGVIELCRKSVKRVKFSEANDVIGSSKIPQLESICKLFSDAMTSSSSSSADMSSEGEKYIAAESSSSHMPEKAFTKAKKANETTDHEKCRKLSNTGSSGLFDLNQALPESIESDEPYTSNLERPSLQHTQDGNFSVDEQALDIGRENQRHATDLDIRAKGKSSSAQPNCTIQDSVQLQKSWCSMTVHHGVSQLSSVGELPSCQFQKYNLSHSAKSNFHPELNVQQECQPTAGQTFRLMGKDLTVSATRIGYLAEAGQKHRVLSDKDNLSAKMILGLPRHGQPFLSLQAPSIPSVSGTSSSMVHDSGNPASKSQAQFGYRTPHNFSQTLPTSSGDPSPYEDRFRGPANSESRQNVLLGYPPLPNHGSAAFLQNLQAPWHYYSDRSTRTEAPSEPFVPAVTRHVTPSSDYHANVPQPYGVYSSSSSVRPCEYMSFALSNTARTVQGVSDSRVSSALPSRYADTARSVPENSNASSSSPNVLRSGPVKLSAGARHILMPSESTIDDNAAPLYSRVSFGSRNANMLAPQEKGADFNKF